MSEAALHVVAKCSSCGRRINLDRVASSAPSGRRRRHRGPVCVFCRLKTLLPAIKRLGGPVAAPGSPERLLTLHQVRQEVGVSAEFLYAATALGLIHPYHPYRPTGRRRRVA
jgi:hypothetical protein